MYEKTCTRCGASIPCEAQVCPVCRNQVDTPESAAIARRRAVVRARVIAGIIVAAIVSYLIAGQVIS